MTSSTLVISPGTASSFTCTVCPFLIISVLFCILFTLILLFIPLGQMGELSDNICPVLSVHVKLSTPKRSSETLPLRELKDHIRKAPANQNNKPQKYWMGPASCAIFIYDRCCPPTNENGGAVLVRDTCTSVWWLCIVLDLSVLEIDPCRCFRDDDGDNRNDTRTAAASGPIVNPAADSQPGQTLVHRHTGDIDCGRRRAIQSVDE